MEIGECLKTVVKVFFLWCFGGVAVVLRVDVGRVNELMVLLSFLAYNDMELNRKEGKAGCRMRLGGDSTRACLGWAI